MSSGGGGADTTEWFERARASGRTAIRWYGTRGKPVGFNESPAVESGSIAVLRRRAWPSHVTPFDDNGVSLHYFRLKVPGGMRNLSIGSAASCRHYALPLRRPRPRVASHFHYPLPTQLAVG